MVRRTSFSARASNYVKRAELHVSHFYNSNHCKWTLKIIFKGSGCSIILKLLQRKKAYALLIVDQYKLMLFYRSKNVTNFSSEGKPVL